MSNNRTGNGREDQELVHLARELVYMKADTMREIFNSLDGIKATQSEQNVTMAEFGKDLKHIKGQVSHHEEHKVSRDSFRPVQLVAYGLVSMLGGAVIAAAVFLALGA